MMLTRKLKKNFSYRNLGGKTFNIEFEVPIREVVKKSFEGNWACYNFMERRTDFNADFKHKLYYGKVDGLGYIIAEDELEAK